MVSGLLAALAAFITALFVFVSPDATPRESAPLNRDALQQRIDDLRASIEAMARSPQSPAEPQAEGSSEGRLSPSGDENGCALEEASGQGWMHVQVQCTERMSGSGSSSVSVSSSSRVTVYETSSE